MKQQFRVGDVTKIKPTASAALSSGHGLEAGVFVKVIAIDDVAVRFGGITRGQVDALPETDGISYEVRVVFEDPTNPVHKVSRFVCWDELELLP